ncbi:bifunctional folylpolyglutamate synthase/dihydrofolate synthase [Amylibacter sp.]|jgi:dihydrofolate synthase/folylpolyglutamate synthase|nr:bifunctional folylpolyglutamate synthase/dihydrofolate synthase [Amylibacter sp.]MDA9229574.1 bifunctional folylpolyglutamate synthase/dihydrofolate synthase [Amylibacter sp.]MDA9243697.1 bifunctional folylpolyglutamate synthase/dihydrofolate synthase [Amylibacter sp.]MDA9300675.1 bifunctional folylpolyglutamate synthase/dihydrofolate synthase [Amylibacter sp.]MDA9926989.1 bifunctional folylpolyglutamate synthase/dihydrofolate synthase [Amylibacter sp.]|tara:strand:- start:378 stop:1643 length:1266 start_codon:yes stop_codon:yes gene_type:complete
MNSDTILERLMTLHPKIIDLTLDRMTRLLDLLGSPEKALPPVIHIAGTNGKGSTQAMIRAGLEASGDICHAYTSPHLARFHERIFLAGKTIAEQDLANYLSKCEKVNGKISITYFEITTCAALLAFSQNKADYTLLEVGLGGRLDATNVIEDPKITVITPISIDHQQYLGNTLSEIAFEKAGILKRNCFAIIGPQEDEALNVIEARALEVGATCKIYGQHWHVWEENGRLIFQDENGLLDLPLPKLIGAHQVQNAGIALATLRYLGKDSSSYDGAMLNADWPARMQKLKNGPLITLAPDAEIWLDGGHNKAAGHALSEAISRLQSRKLFLIVGMLNTKDVMGYMQPLLNKSSDLYGVSIPGEAATMSAQETVDIAKDVGFKAIVSENVESAIKDIVKYNHNARILICGSLYLAGNILKENF